MFRPELALAVDSGPEPPSTVTDCVARAIRAEYRLGQVKDDWAQNFKARMEERNREKNGSRRYQGGNNNNGARHQGNNQAQTGNNNKKGGKPNGNQASDNRKVEQKTNNGSSTPICGNYGKSHFGVCRKGSSTCFSCGQSGHFIKDYPS